MKNVSFVFCIAIFLFACKKDKSSKNSETVLSKMYSNNKLTYEFIYSPQKQLARINEYDESTGTLTNYTSFDYNANGKVTTENYYSNNKLGGKTVYTFDVVGNISQHQYMSLSGADSGKFINRVKYSYDGSGRISQQMWVNIITSVPETSRDLVYYDNNNLRSSSAYSYSGSAKLQWKTEYSAGTALPVSLTKSRGYPINFLLYDMVTGEEHYTQYNSIGTVISESTETFTDKKLDSDGYLLEQTYTKKDILPAGPAKALQLRYEYIKL